MATVLQDVKEIAAQAESLRKELNSFLLDLFKIDRTSLCFPSGIHLPKLENSL